MQTILENFVYPGLLVLALALLTAIARVLVQDVWPQIRAEMIQRNHAREAMLIDRALNIAVAAAEQVGENNAEKKRMATNIVQHQLKKLNISLSNGDLDDLIEATVYRLLKTGITLVDGELEITDSGPTTSD